jgi:hypothetical protein
MLLNSGSPWAHKFVANNLFGPHLRTSQKLRSAFEHKLVELDLIHESLVGLKVHLDNYSLSGVPGIVSEDATTALRRLDFELLESQTAASAWEAGVKLWGFDGGTVTVHSIEQLRAEVTPPHPSDMSSCYASSHCVRCPLDVQFGKRSLAAYVYVYTWVPILKNAPWFPFAIIATDNKFDASWVFERWRIIQTSCAQLELLLAGHVSDGDARLRKCDFRINFGSNSLEQGWCKAVHGSKLHHMLYLTLPETNEGLIIFGHQDYLHLLWRLRVQMLTPKKVWQVCGGCWAGQLCVVRPTGVGANLVWQIGPGLTTAASHLTNLRNASGDVLLNGKDLDPHNKQHWPGVLKMFSSNVSAALKARIDGPAKEVHLKGTYCMIVVFERYLGSWLKDRDEGRLPVDAIRDASFVMAFLLHWRYYVDANHSLTNNFLTRMSPCHVTMPRVTRPRVTMPCVTMPRVTHHATSPCHVTSPHPTPSHR